MLIRHLHKLQRWKEWGREPRDGIMWNRQLCVLEINLCTSASHVCHKISPGEHLTEQPRAAPQLPDGLHSDSERCLSPVAPSVLWDNCFMCHSVHFQSQRRWFPVMLSGQQVTNRQQTWLFQLCVIRLMKRELHFWFCWFIIRPHYFYFHGELKALKQKLVEGGHLLEAL